MTQKVKLAVKQYKEYDFSTRNTLNPKLWEDEALKEDVHSALMKIAEEFIKFLNLDLDFDEIADIQLTGSLANYNYTNFSDIDLHILFDFNKIDENEKLVKELLMSKKTIWNKNYPIKVKGYEVEVYPQHLREEHFSTGIYSIMADNWEIKPEVPSKVWSKINIADIKKKAEELKYEIDSLETNEDKTSAIDRIKEKIKNMRKAGLESGGEYSVENLVFKVLRRMGYLNKLYTIGREEYKKSLSLNGACT